MRSIIGHAEWKSIICKNSNFAHENDFNLWIGALGLEAQLAMDDQLQPWNFFMSAFFHARFPLCGGKILDFLLLEESLDLKLQNVDMYR